MLGGSTPVTQLVAMVHGLPAPQAAGLLMSVPTDRLDATLSTLKLADIVKVLQALKPGDQGRILARLSPEQIGGLLRTMPAGQAGRLLSSLSQDQLLTLVRDLPAAQIPALLQALDPVHHDMVLKAMDPYWAGKLLATRYQRGVAQALARTNVKITSPVEGDDDVLLVEVYGRFIVVTLHYQEHGLLVPQDLKRAEEEADRARAHGALAVSNVRLAEGVSEYHREALRWGRLVNAVTWVDPRDDGVLARVLVGLVR